MAVDSRNGSLTSEIGVTGIVRYGGIIDDEPLSDLRGMRRTQTIKQMISNDPTIGALLFSIKMLIRQMTWRVDAVSEDQEDERAAELVRTALFEDMSLSWKDMLSDVVSFLPWGWSFHETVYKYRDGNSTDPTRRSRFTDGLIGWRKMPIRRQETLYEWVFDESGGIQAMKQQAAPDYVVREIPIEKAVLFRTESAGGNPEGYSVLRNAYRPWRMKTRIENLEGIGIERDLAGLPVAYLPPEYMAPTATDAQRAVFESVKTLVTNIRRDEQEGIVMPMAYDASGHKTFDLQLLSSGGDRQFDIDGTVNRYDHRILMSVMADFMMLGAEKVGSLALSSDKTDLFAVALGAWADSIADIMNTHPIPRLIRLNGMSVKDTPKLRHGDIETPDLAELADFVQKTVSAGAMTPDRTLEDALRSAANLPELPEDEARVLQ